MQDNNQMTEQIFTNIDHIGELMETTVDLNSDVAPFMSGTLAKIKHLALAKETEFEAQYNLFQIAVNHLPRAVNAYCSLPIEYRNIRPIKGNKTARQLLIEDLNIFKKQVNEIEEKYYSAIESQIKVNSNVVREKYDSKFQLATQLEHVGEDGFVNQFDFSQYKEALDYKNIKFKKEPNMVQIKAQERKEAFKNSVNKAIDFTTKVGKSAYKNVAPVFPSLMEHVIAPLCFFGVIVTFLYFAISFMLNSDNPRDLSTRLSNTSAQIHKVMDVAMIPNSEFKGVIESKKKELIGDSDYYVKHISFQTDPIQRVMTVQALALDKDSCMKMIDEKEKNFDFTTMKVNGISLPDNNVTSDYYALKNKNHSLCHLESGNRVSIEFNNQKIYDKPQPSSDEKGIILKKMKEEAQLYKEEALIASSSYSHSSLKDMEKLVHAAIDKLSKTH